MKYKKNCNFAVKLKSMDVWLKDILLESLQMASPSGSEEQIIEFFAKAVMPYVDEVNRDANGNCIAHKKGNGPKIMFMAHADEVGFMINYIDDRGFLYFNQIGAIDTNLLPGQRIFIQGVRPRQSGLSLKSYLHQIGTQRITIGTRSIAHQRMSAMTSPSSASGLNAVRI